MDTFPTRGKRGMATLQRAEQRERQKSGIQYLVSPARVDRCIMDR
jgi:hypothetical protein